MKIFVGNLSRDAIDDDIKKAFGEFGSVGAINIKKDKGVSRGFGFVYMPNEAEAQAALRGLQGKELLGRALKISPATIRPDKRRVTLQKRESAKPKPKPLAQPKTFSAPKPWRKSAASEKPTWKRKSEESRPWKRAGTGIAPKPWRPPVNRRKPWQKPEVRDEHKK